MLHMRDQQGGEELEEMDTRLILHSCEAVSQGHKRVSVICRDTGVM